MYDLKDFSYPSSENDFYDDLQEFEEYDEDEEIRHENLYDLWNNCVVLSCHSIFSLICRIILSNILLGLITTYVRIPLPIYHLLSGSIGIYLASEVDSFEGKCIIIYSIAAYIIVVANHFIKKQFGKDFALTMKIIVISSLIISEHSLIDKEIFIRIRGILMILVMKILHLIDETSGNDQFVGVLQYFGYTFCSANILFGPWITYKEYEELCLKPKKKNMYWIFGMVRSFLLSITCLLMSNCFASYFISDASNRWLLAYRDALAFRYSHYFVSFLAEMSMICAGYNNSKCEDNQWNYTIVSPLDIEFPTSLSIVVTKWNQPIHLFLKKSIYSPLRKYGPLTAVMATFLVSSFLHGLEVRVSVVLLSLGIFSYLQVKSRILISNAMDACLNVKPCKHCTHKFGRDNLFVKFVLFLYSFDSILHLAYLGILMDPVFSEMSIFEQWSDLYFISHAIMFINFLLII